MSSNSDLIDEVIDKIVSGNRETTAQHLREVLIDMIGSYQNVDGRNTINGYASLDSSGKIPSSLLSTAAPTLYKFLRDDGVFSKLQNSFKSSSGAVLESKYTVFEFTGTSVHWTFPLIEKDKIYWVLNTGSGILTIDSHGGGNDFILSSGGSATNNFTVSANSYALVIDDGDRLIVTKGASFDFRNPWITDSFAIASITDTGNWNGGGIYTGPSISVRFGDEYSDSSYWYRVMIDNSIIRLSRV